MTPKAIKVIAETPESREMVKTVDGYPPWIRERLRAAVEQMVAVYGKPWSMQRPDRADRLPQAARGTGEGRIIAAELDSIPDPVVRTRALRQALNAIAMVADAPPTRRPRQAPASASNVIPFPKQV